MKKLLIASWCVVVAILFTVNAYSEPLNVDISQSTFEVTGPNTFTIRNATATALGLGINGKYWAQFQWEPINYNLLLVGYGAESGTPPSGRTWTVIPYEDTGTVQLTISFDQTNRLIHISVTGATGYAYACYANWKFIQGNNTFRLDSPQFPCNYQCTNYARMTPDSGWNLCSAIYAGQTKTGTISNIPAWFDFNAQFTFFYDQYYPSNTFVLR